MEKIFPTAIDNSIRKEIVKCQMIGHWKHELGLNEGEDSVDLHAGGAFASGMEAMRGAYYIHGYDMAGALSIGIAKLHEAYGAFKCPEKSNKSADRMAGALAYFASENPLDVETLRPFQLPSGEWTIEVSFNYPIPIAHPDTHQPLTYCGRFDMLALDSSPTEDGAKEVWVVDEKTTKSLGDAWTHQWQLDSAMTGYCWGARRLLDSHGLTDWVVKGAIVNGVAIRALSNALPYEHVRLPVFREAWFIDRWFMQMLRDVEGWKGAYLAGGHHQVLDAHAGCAIYNSPCPYMRLCNSAEPEKLFGSYTVRWWNPLTRETSSSS